MANGEPDLNIHVKSTNDPRGTQAAKKDVQDLKKEVKSLGDAYREAGGGFKGLGAAGKQAAELYKDGGKGVAGVFNVLSGGAAKAAVGIGAVTAAAIGGKKALKEFGEEEKSIRGLQAALAQNGLLTSEVNQRYQELASTLEELTGKADTEWIEVLKRLTQFGSTPDRIQKDIEAVKNLAGILGGDLQSAAAGITRAMQGNFEMFSRWGIVVDEAASKSERLEQLYVMLAQRGGGQLEASIEGVSGTFEKFGNHISNFFEAIGQRIASLGVVQHVLYGLGTTIGWLAKLIGGVVPAAEGMRNALKKSGDAAVDAERFNKQYNESLKETANHAKAVADALEKQIEAQRELRQLQDEQADAEMALEIALVDRREKAQKISPEEAIRQRSVIRTKAAGAKHQREQDGRNEEMAHRQRQIDAAMLQIEEENTEAEIREGEVLSDEEIQKRRGALHAKLEGEVQHWKRNYQALLADPTSFSNPELGEKAGARWGKGLHDLGARITARVRSAEAARDARMEEFDKQHDPVVSGAKARAEAARNRANLTAEKEAPRINDLTMEIERIRLEKEAAALRFQTTTKTAAVQTGTEALGVNPGVNTKTVEAEVIRASNAFQGKMDNLGATIVERFESDGQAIQDLTRRLRLLEEREKHDRYRR